MSCKIFTFPSFEKEAKRLNKRYKSFKSDLKELMNELSSSPSLGADLGGGLRKVRMAIKSKGTGKSSGARYNNSCVSRYRGWSRLALYL